MPVGFAVLDKRIRRDTEALHNYLWQGVEGREEILRTNLLKDARDADTFLKLKGRLRRNVEALVKPWNKGPRGESLFELLEHTWGLAAATVEAAKGNHRAAAKRAQDVVSSASIGVCANAGCFEFVEEWESGKIDFETYTGKLAAHLEPKGVLDAGQFQRMLNTVYDFGMSWNGAASKPEQAVAARSAIDGAAWSLLTSVSIRELLGSPPKFAPRDFSDIVERIVGRV